MILNDPNSNFLSSLMHLLQLFFFPDGQSFSLIRMTLLSCFLGKSGKMRSFSYKKAFQSYNQTITSVPASDLDVVSLGTGTGDSRICLFLSNEGGPIESSKVHDTKNSSIFYVQAKQPFNHHLDLYFLSHTSGRPLETGTRDSGIHISLSSQGAQIKSSKETWHRKNNSTSYVKSYNLQIWSFFTFTSFPITDFQTLSFFAMSGEGGLFHFHMPKSNTNSDQFQVFAQKKHLTYFLFY
jgi:hypothetical protein